MIDEEEKLKKVILSCKTKEQLFCAYKMYKLWAEKNGIGDRVPASLVQQDSYYLGIFKGMLQQYE